MNIYEKINELGHQLPPTSPPVGNFLPVVESNGLVCVSGQLPRRDGKLLHPGKVGSEVTIEQAQDATKAALLCGLSALNDKYNNLDVVVQFLQLKGYVNAVPDFSEHGKIIETASNLLVEIFGDSGRHARAALGVGSLPSNSCVEIELMLRVKV